MIDDMLEDSGSQLKQWARKYLRGSIVGAVIEVIACIVLSAMYPGIACAILFGGGIVIAVGLRISHLFALLLTARGEMLETNERIAEGVEELNRAISNPEGAQSRDEEPVSNAYVSKLAAARIEAKGPGRNTYARKKTEVMMTPAGERTPDQILGFALQLPTEEKMREHLSIQINSDIPAESKEICRRLLEKPEGMLRNAMLRVLMHQEDMQD